MYREMVLVRERKGERERERERDELTDVSLQGNGTS